MAVPKNFNKMFDKSAQVKKAPAPAPEPEPQSRVNTVRLIAETASSGPDDHVDTVVLVIRRVLNPENNGLTMDCATARNGVVIHSIGEPVGPGYEVHEAARGLRSVERLWRHMRSGKGLPWSPR